MSDYSWVKQRAYNHSQEQVLQALRILVGSNHAKIRAGFCHAAQQLLYAACNYASYQYTAACYIIMIGVRHSASKLVVYHWTTIANGENVKLSVGATCKSACIQQTCYA